MADRPGYHIFMEAYTTLFLATYNCLYLTSCIRRFSTTSIFLILWNNICVKGRLFRKNIFYHFFPYCIDLCCRKRDVILIGGVQILYLTIHSQYAYIQYSPPITWNPKLVLDLIYYHVSLRFASTGGVPGWLLQNSPPMEILRDSLTVITALIGWIAGARDCQAKQQVTLIGERTRMPFSTSSGN